MAPKSQVVSVVTGGAGFLGSHLTDRLIAEGHRVIAIDNLRSEERRVGKECRSGWVRDQFQAEDGIRDLYVTGVQTCALPISKSAVSSVSCSLKSDTTGR